MADTDIEWATKVWNFVRGCRRVSPGCGGAAGVGGCYAESQANRFKAPGQPYEGLVELGKQGPRWTGVGRFVPEKLGEPMTWRAPRDGSRHRVFVNSMSDLFFEQFTNEQIAAGFGVMAACPQHDFLILTKRAERMREWFRWVEHQQGSESALPERVTCYLSACREEHLGGSGRIPSPAWPEPGPWPLPNVWLGVSCEDQRRAEERIPHLLQCPAAVRWVSAEPLLEPLNLADVVIEDGAILKPLVGLTWRRKAIGLTCDGAVGPKIDWVVTGGESGNGARPCDARWIASIVEQCAAANVPAFVKQLGAKPFETVDDGVAMVACLRELRSRKGGDPAEWSPELRVRQFPEVRP